MKCPTCQTVNKEGARFCIECGHKLELKCPQCGHPLPPVAKFCEMCGHPLPKLKEAPPIDYSKPHSYTPKFLAEKILSNRRLIEGERKLVTVLFADVANYTAMSEKLDPEEVRQIVDGCFRILMDEIHKWEGTITQFTGDGLMAILGAPIAHEDHAQRACYTALSIQKAMAEYGEKVRKERGLEFKMRLGLNSGPVVVGSIGNDLRMDYTAIGDTVNLASRMESTAKPGSILVSGFTHKLVRDYFEFESLGKVQVKGKEELQEAYELLMPSEVKTRIEAAALAGLTKFVGRKREMEALREALEKVRSGSGQVVGIVGEAGVGKSRIIFEIKQMLPKEEYGYLEGRCIHYGGSIAYLPILDILRSFFEIKEGEQEFPIKKKIKEKIIQFDEKLKTVVPPFQELLSLRVDDEAYLKLEPKQKREEIFEAIRDLLIRESQKKPLVLVFEDLQWIDKTSEEFLDYFIGWLANTPILLILLYRSEYTHRWASRSYYSNVRVDQLSLQTSAELVQSILKEGEIVPEIRELILNKAAGNPLFMEELTHKLLENGTIQREGDHYLLNKKPSDIQVPDTVQGIIAARMDRLEESLKRIMQVASVIGREFAFRILQAITEMKEELKSHLLNLQGLEFIYEKKLFPELEYIFKHALTQEVAYNSLLLKTRKEIHEKIGRAIEQIYAERLEEFYEMLAYHYSKSNNLEQAYQYLKLSGKKAMGGYSPTEAFRFYRDAISILKKMGETDKNKKEQIEVILSMAHSMRLLAYPEDSFKILQEGETLCRDVKDKKSLAVLYSHLGSFYSAKGDAVLGMKYQQDAFEEAERLQDTQITARIGAMLTFSMDVAGEYRKVVHITPRILASLEKTQGQGELFGMPVDLRSYLYANYGHGLGYVGEFGKGEEACNKALSLAQEADNVYSIAIAEFLYGCLFSPKGDGENSVKHMESSIGYLEKLKAVFFLPLTWCLIGEGYRLMGDPGKALGFEEKGLHMKMYIGAPGWLSLHFWALSLVHFDLGNLNEARVHAERSLNLAQTNHEKYFEGESWLQLGRTVGKMEESQIDKAEEYILQGMKMLDDLETKPAYAVGCLTLGELYLDAGRKEKALEYLRRSEEMFSRMGMDYHLARTKKLFQKL